MNNKLNLIILQRDAARCDADAAQHGQPTGRVHPADDEEMGQR